MQTNRRHLLKYAGAAVALVGPPSSAQESQKNSDLSHDDGLFTKLAMRDASDKSDTRRIQGAIDATAAKGGGTVHIPAGRYVTGSVILRSHVSLWIDNGATISMSPDDSEFLPAEKLAYDPGANRATSDFHVAMFIGDNVEHIAIYGEGEIECERGKRGGGPKPIALRRCKYLTLSGFSMRNAQNYNISLLGCEFVRITALNIHRGWADGIDPDCCRHVVISDCFIESVDDSLCLKSSGSLGERAATEFVTVTNCILRTASIHFKCGTESCGDFRNITLANCVFEGGAGFRHGNPGIAFYTVDGGSLEGVTISNITMHHVATPLAMIRGDRDRCNTGKGPGALRDIRISNIVATGASLPSVIAGVPGAPAQNISIEDISVNTLASHRGVEYTQNVPENPKGYPAPVMFGELPSFGLYVRHAESISITTSEFHAPAGELRPDIFLEDVKSLRLRGHERRGAGGPVHLVLKNVRDSYVECLAVEEPPDHAIHVIGEETQRLFLRAQGAIEWKRHLAIDSTVGKRAISAS